MVYVLVISSIICCNGKSVNDDAENNSDKVVQTKEMIPQKDDELPDSLFEGVNLDDFKLSDIPFDSNDHSVNLNLIQGPLLKKIIKTIGQGNDRLNAYYYSKQKSGKGYCITIFLTSENDSGSIFLLKMDENLDIKDYHRIGFDECTLADQTEECDIVNCNQISCYTKNQTDYYIITKDIKRFDCIGKEIQEEIKQDTLLVN